MTSGHAPRTRHDDPHRHPLAGAGQPPLVAAMNLPINAANVLFVLGYFTTDMPRLRLLSAVGTALAVACFCSQPEPMLNVVAWNVLVLELTWPSWPAWSPSGGGVRPGRAGAPVARSAARPRPRHSRLEAVTCRNVCRG